MEHDHSHNHGHIGHVHGSTSGPMLWISLIITSLFVVGEGITGYMANSLALMSDAGHNFSDALALGLAAYAVWIAKKPANSKKTFGYHRVAILTALFNSVTLVVLALAIFLEASHLFLNPENVDGSMMIWVAGIAFLMNTVIALLLRGGAKESLNMKAAFVHMAGDAASSLLVVIAGFVVNRTGWVYTDPLVSVIIGIFILYTSWGIIKEASDILLEGTPKGLEIEKMVATIKDIKHVEEVHDFHAWTVSDGLHYLSCHVAVSDTRTMEECGKIIEEVNELMAHQFGIAHTTIQIEIFGGCPTAQETLFCGNPSGSHH